MKTTTSAVISAIAAARAAPDATLVFAECFTFTLATATILTWTNVDQTVTYNGAVFSAVGSSPNIRRPLAMPHRIKTAMAR